MAGRAGTRTPEHGCGARPAAGGTGIVSGTAAPGYARRPAQSGAPVPVPPFQDRGAGMGAEWPLRDFLELGALPGAVPSARLHARQILWEWSLTSLSDLVELVVSELVSNSVAASRSMPEPGPVKLWLLTDKRRVLILVWDQSPKFPTLHEVDIYAETGRGIFLVAMTSTRWGTYPTPDHGGKVVWAVCDTELIS